MIYNIKNKLILNRDDKLITIQYDAMVLLMNHKNSEYIVFPNQYNFEYKLKSLKIHSVKRYYIHKCFNILSCENKNETEEYFIDNNNISDLYDFLLKDNIQLLLNDIKSKITANIIID